MARPAPWRRDIARYPFQAIVPTRWADLDLLGHINNVSMAGLFEEGRGKFNREFRFPRVTGVRWLIVGVDLAYLAEAHHPDDLVIASGIGHVGTRSWTILSGAFQGGQCVATADTSLVYTDPSGPVPLPPHFVSAFAEKRIDDG